MKRHVERDHAKAVGHRGIVEHMAILAAVRAGGVQAEQRRALSRLLHVDAVRHAVDGDGAVASDNGLEVRHRALPSRA